MTFVLASLYSGLYL